jgi:hypothetical protein
MEDRHLVGGRCNVDIIREECAAFTYTPRIGEMVIFGKGRVHEILPVGAGSSRWTIGGFFTFSQDDQRVLYFS